MAYFGRCMLVFYFIVYCVTSSPVVKETRQIKYSKNRISANERETCPETEENVPSTRVNTTERLRALRDKLASEGLDAYFIPSEDAHGSEYPSSYDMRRGYISGFSGSAGYAVVTQNEAALWTDSRYFLQAELELDCNWILMKQGETGFPLVIDWLKSVLASGSKLGGYPFIITNGWWTYLESGLADAGISIVSTDPDLMDLIWNDGTRPAQPDNTINAFPMHFSGKSAEQKVTEVREKMSEVGTSAVIVTDLFETAWLINARSSDIAYNPVFLSYTIIEMNRARVYILNPIRKLIEGPTDDETTMTLAEHLNTRANGSCVGQTGFCIQVKNYDLITSDVTTLVNETGNSTIWISRSCNYAVFSLIPSDKRYQSNTPIALMKAKKNTVEIDGMRNAYVRDSAAMCIFLEKLEKEVKAGETWTEVSAAEELARIRGAQKYNRGLSFASISSSGPNGAIVHYEPKPGAQNRDITTSEMYLLDSGGQYLDGTTDITRTFHYGTPTAKEKEMYTRVLMAMIDLARLVWPSGLYGRQIDAIARAPIWEVGLNYLHGTGHGIGHYLSVHEGPGNIGLTAYPSSSDVPLEESMFFSDEPGYYEEDKFGIRLETIVMVEKKQTKYTFNDIEFLGFTYFQLVPFETHLIDYELMNNKQIEWLRKYNEDCLQIVGEELRTQNQQAALTWLEARTGPIATYSDANVVYADKLLAVSYKRRAIPSGSQSLQTFTIDRLDRLTSLGQEEGELFYISKYRPGYGYDSGETVLVRMALIPFRRYHQDMNQLPLTLLEKQTLESLKQGLSTIHP